MLVDFVLRDGHVSEEFVNITAENPFHLTTEQVKHMPIVKNNIPIGHLIEADEDCLYGIIYNLYVFYKDDIECNFSVHMSEEEFKECLNIK